MARYQIGNKIIEADTFEEALAKFTATLNEPADIGGPGGRGDDDDIGPGGGPGSSGQPGPPGTDPDIDPRDVPDQEDKGDDSDPDPVPTGDAKKSGEVNIGDIIETTRNGITYIVEVTDINPENGFVTGTIIDGPDNIGGLMGYTGTDMANMGFAVPGQEAPPELPGSSNQPPPSSGVPSAEPDSSEAPTDFVDLLEQLGAQDIIRSFALDTGIAPGFRRIAENAATRSLVPFGFQATMGDIPGLTFEEFETDPLGEFRKYLESGPNRLPGIRDTLGQAFDFLGRDFSGEGDPIYRSPAQESVLQNLINEGATGSELFAPTLALLGNMQRGRSIPGFGVSGATVRALENILAREPTRFGTAQQFGDYLRQQGIIEY